MDEKVLLWTGLLLAVVCLVMACANAAAGNIFLAGVMSTLSGVIAILCLHRVVDG